MGRISSGVGLVSGINSAQIIEQLISLEARPKQLIQTRIDQMVAELKANPKGNFVEIEGHTDSSGDKITNQRIGEQRAEAVKRYLYEAHQVPLHKINVISWGEDKPVSPNNTREGRAQNRRVVIRILA